MQPFLSHTTSSGARKFAVKIALLPNLFIVLSMLAITPAYAGGSPPNMPDRLPHETTPTASDVSGTGKIDKAPAPPVSTTPFHSPHLSAKSTETTVPLQSGEPAPAKPDTTKAVTLTSSGMLLIPDTVTLFSPHKGQIKKSHKTTGASFSAGDILFEFDCVDLQAALEEQRLEHHSSKLKNKVMLQNFMTGQITREELNLTELNVEIALAKLNRLRREIMNCRVTAPITGYVLTLLASKDKSVDELSPLAVLAPSKVPQFELWVPVEWLQWLTVGMRFTVKIASQTAPYDAKIEHIGQKVDSLSQKIRVRARVINPTGDLRPGLMGTAEFPPP